MASTVNVLGRSINYADLGLYTGITQAFALYNFTAPRKAFTLNLVLGIGSVVATQIFDMHQYQDIAFAYMTGAVGANLVIGIYKGLPTE